MRLTEITRKITLICGFCLLVCLLSGCGGKPPVFQNTTYETEAYPKQVGYDVADNAASKGEARFSYQQTGLLVWGQYQTLDKGRYTAVFRLMIGETKSNDPVVALSISSGGITQVGQTKSLAMKVLRPAGLKPAYRYVEVPLSFSTDPATDIEYRVQVLRPDVFVWSDNIKISKGTR